MSRRDRSENPDPELARELAALDAALEGRAGPGDDLGDLVAAVREQRPRPAAAWTRELDRRVARRFEAQSAPRRRRASLPAPLGRAGAWLRSGRRWRLLAPAAGTLVPLLILAAVLGAHSGSPGRPSQLTSPAPPAGATARAPESGSVAAPHSGGGHPAVAGPSPRVASGPSPQVATPGPGQPHRVHRTVAVTLAPPASGIAGTADGVVRVTDSFGGNVQSSSVNTADGGQGGASFDLRLPADRLGPALDALSRLAHVRSRSDQSEDITRPFDDAASLVADTTAARDSLRRQLAGASTPRQAARLRAALAGAEDRLRSATAQLGSLRQASDLVAVSVSIEPATGAAGAPPSSGSWTLGDAAEQAQGILLGAAGVLLIALAVALPVAALTVVGLAAARFWRQRARERALGAQT